MGSSNAGTKLSKENAVRPGSPLSLQEARELVERYIQHYNEKRLHSAIGYVAPMDKLEGRENKIFHQRDKKLEEARGKRSRKNKIKIAA
jgi:putative transposase